MRPATITNMDPYFQAVFEKWPSYHFQSIPSRELQIAKINTSKPSHQNLMYFGMNALKESVDKMSYLLTKVGVSHSHIFGHN